MADKNTFQAIVLNIKIRIEHTLLNEFSMHGRTS